MTQQDSETQQVSTSHSDDQIQIFPTQFKVSFEDN